MSRVISLRPAFIVALIAIAALLGVAVGYSVLPRLIVEERQKLVIAVQPTATPEVILEASKGLERFLERKLSVEVEVYVPTTYAAVIEALRFGHAHVGLMSAWPALLAVKLGGGELALAEVREVFVGGERIEETFYFSYWVVMKDSPYVRLQDLRGKKACFPSPLSTSGYVMPLGRLIELGLLPAPEKGKEADPKQFFGEFFFAGGYAQCWEALRHGHVDITVIAGDVAEDLYRDVLAGTRVLEQQGPIPSHGVVFGKALAEPLRGKVKEALMGLGKPEYRALMRKLVSALFVGFKEVDASKHLGQLVKYLEMTGLKYTERL